MNAMKNPLSRFITKLAKYSRMARKQEELP